MSGTPADTNYPLSANDAAAKLVEISAAYKAAQPAPALHELSPELAGQRLADMEKAYRGATKPKNSASDTAILGGDDRPAREFETVSWPQTTTHNKLNTIETLRNVGIPDKGIENILRGDSDWITPKDIEMARQWMHRAEHDSELRAAILRGEPEAVHFLTGMSAILAYGAKA
jgi:hypothetical protein